MKLPMMLSETMNLKQYILPTSSQKRFLRAFCLNILSKKHITHVKLTLDKFIRLTIS